MKRESASKAVERAERRALVKALIGAGLWECQIGVTLRRESFIGAHAIDYSDIACVGEPSGIHERRKRSSGGSLTLLANLMPACTWHNQWCEREPEIAHELGLVVRPGDREWFLCGGDRGGF